MKPLLVVLFVTFQAIISSTALAWSPLNSFDSAVESMQQCYTVIASGEEDQEGKENQDEDEEEEPDCD